MQLLRSSVLPLFLLCLSFTSTEAWAKQAKKKQTPVPAASKINSFRSAIEARKEEFHSCFERENLKDSPDSESKETAASRTIETHFVITPEGKAILIRVTRAIPPQPRAEECIVRLLRQVHFPKPADGKNQEVSFPFHYSH